MRRVVVDFVCIVCAVYGNGITAERARLFASDTIAHDYRLDCCSHGWIGPSMAASISSEFHF